MSNNILKYQSETDRCYGIAGMVVSAYAFDSLGYLSRIDSSLSDIDVMVMSPEFEIMATQDVSAKAVWHARMSRYRLVAAMMIGNVVSRAVGGQRPSIDPATLQSVIDLLDDEADYYIGLEHDENRRLCLNAYDHLRKVFAHPVVRQVTSSLADRIGHTKIMEAAEIHEILSPLF